MNLKRTFIAVLTVLSFSSLPILSGCEDKKELEVTAGTESKDKDESIKANTESEENVISHEDYQEYFFEMVKDLEFSHYTFMEATENANITAIEKDFSFGKRENLTLDGEQSHLETQERLVFQKDDKTTYLIIDVIYLNESLENDMVYWNTRNGKAFEENSPLRIFDDNLLVVKNLLFQTMILSTNGKGLISEDSYTVTKELIDYLEKKKLTQ